VKKRTRSPRYKNTLLLKAIGEHCRNLRVKKGYSIDRVYREGEQLSTSVIHRLENGAADTQISVFYRYAQVLGHDLKELFDLDISGELSTQILPYQEGEDRPKLCVPYYPISVAAGFADPQSLLSEEPSGWVKIETHRQLTGLFAVHIKGRSMEPMIPNGSLCLFRAYQGGTRQNKVLLIKSRRLLDPETEMSYMVKRYKRLTPVTDTQNRNRVVIHLISENKDYSPIVLQSSSEKEISVLAEFIEVIA
jgi:hypothetical protein